MSLTCQQPVQGIGIQPLNIQQIDPPLVGGEGLKQPITGTPEITLISETPLVIGDDLIAQHRTHTKSAQVVELVKLACAPARVKKRV